MSGLQAQGTSQRGVTRKEPKIPTPWVSAERMTRPCRGAGGGASLISKLVGQGGTRLRDLRCSASQARAPSPSGNDPMPHVGKRIGCGLLRPGLRHDKGAILGFHRPMSSHFERGRARALASCAFLADLGDTVSSSPVRWHGPFNKTGPPSVPRFPLPLSLCSV